MNSTTNEHKIDVDLDVKNGLQPRSHETVIQFTKNISSLYKFVIKFIYNFSSLLKLCFCWHVWAHNSAIYM